MDHHSSPGFTQDQRSRLDKLGVTVAQIDELEAVALPIGRAWLGSAPTMRDVRSELQALSDAMKAARNAMSRLLDEGAQTPAQREAAARVAWAIYEMGNGEAIKKALDAVVLMRDAVENATREMPQEERRNRTASMIPVRTIAEALSSGFAKQQRTIHAHAIDPSHEPPAWLMEYIRQRQAKLQAVQPGFVKPSSSPGSAFRKIVGICYEAMNQGEADPERAIKAYIAARKRNRQAHDELYRRWQWLQGIAALVTVLKRRSQALHDSETGTAGGQKS